MFAWLMVAQWVAGVAAAIWIVPQTWIGATSKVNLHVWASIFLGAAIAALPVFLALRHPGQVLTRHVIAFAQMLFSALLIHVTGGRIETHFHVFGSLAFLAFYRDWRVLITATVIVAADHMARGLFWPASVFGVLTTSSWRWVEHAGWVIFEDTFLLFSIQQSLKEMTEVSAHRAGLESINSEIEEQVRKRTAELTVAHEELQMREERFRSLSASAPIGIFLRDTSGKALYFNPAWLKITGLSLEESVGDGWQKAIHPEDKPGLLAARLATTGPGQDLDHEFRFIRPTGEVRWVQARSVPVRDNQGVITGHVGTVEDITERKRAGELLRLQEAALRSAANVIVITNREGNIVWTNPAFTHITGYTADEALGKNPRVLQHKSAKSSYSPDYYQNLWKTISSGEVWHGEFHNARKDGSELIEEATITPVPDEKGEITHYVAVKQDITARKHAEAELARAQKELVEASRYAGMAEVATGVLHNVGNALNSVNVSATLVAESTRKSKIVNLNKIVELIDQNQSDLGRFFRSDPKGLKIPGYLRQLSAHLAAEQKKIISETETLCKNIDHIRDIVTMQQSLAKASGVTETLAAQELVENAIQMNASSLARHDVQIIKDFADAAVTIERHKALQVLINLIRNAKQSCDETNRDDKQITLRIRNTESRVRISVTDNGIGIPPENLTRIFNHGFTTKKSGHGFGLHSSANAAREMGGSLQAYSEGSDRGATFTLELPAADPKHLP